MERCNTINRSNIGYIKELEQDIDKKSGYAYYLLGLEYYWGEFVNKDLEKSLNLLKEAKAAGYICDFSIDMVTNEIAEQCERKNVRYDIANNQ